MNSYKNLAQHRRDQLLPMKGDKQYYININKMERLIGMHINLF